MYIELKFYKFKLLKKIDGPTWYQNLVWGRSRVQTASP